MTPRRFQIFFACSGWVLVEMSQARHTTVQGEGKLSTRSCHSDQLQYLKPKNEKKLHYSSSLILFVFYYIKSHFSSVQLHFPFWTDFHKNFLNFPQFFTFFSFFFDFSILFRFFFDFFSIFYPLVPQNVSPFEMFLNIPELSCRFGFFRFSFVSVKCKNYRFSKPFFSRESWWTMSATCQLAPPSTEMSTRVMRWPFERA